MGTQTTSARSSAILFGQTRRDILGLLLGRPDERFYLREIVRAVGGGSGGVQRELKQLVEAGLLNRVREGRQVYFSANRSASIFPELHAIVQKTAGSVEILRAALSSLFRDDRIVIAFVYGSVASGKQHATSDIDLLIAGRATLAEVVQAIRPAEAKLGQEVNASVYPVSEFQKKLKSGSGFLTRVVAGPKLFVAGDEDELDRLAGEPRDRPARGDHG